MVHVRVRWIMETRKDPFVLYCAVLCCAVLYCIILYCIVSHCIDRRLYLNLFFKSNQSSAGLKAFKPAANGRYLTCKIIITPPFPFHVCTEVQKYMYPPVSKYANETSRQSSVVNESWSRERCEKRGPRQNPCDIVLLFHGV